MFSRLREHFGTAGLLVAIVALVAALGGGAYAATGGSGGAQATASAKGKQGKPGKPGKTGKTGPAGPAGPAGPKGDAGPAGPTGPKGDTGGAGVNGTSATTTSFSGPKASCAVGGVEVKSASAPVLVCNGNDGQTGFTETLPSQKTETGSFAAVFEGVGSFVGISFSIPLAAPLEAAQVVKNPLGYDGEDEIGVAHETCPGTAANPRAKAGFLCVYLGYGSGSISEIESIFDPSKGPFGSGGAATVGAGLSFPESQSGFASGTWAVTAP